MTNNDKIQNLKKVLLRAACRAGYAGATEKQCWLMAKLTVEQGDEVYERELQGWILDTGATLTKKDASAFIDMDLCQRQAA